MDFLELMARRHSCRRFTDEPLASEQMERLLLAACAAPIGSNLTEDIHLTVVSDRSVLDAFSLAMGRRRRDKAAMTAITEKVSDAAVTEGTTFDPFYGAPTVVFISHRRQELQPGIEFSNVMSVAMAMHLEATELGLGSVFIWGALEAMRMYPEYDRTELLELPEDFEPLLGLAVGHPAAPAAQRLPSSHRLDVNFIP